MDRNGCRDIHGFNLSASLSARRAWIEIMGERSQLYQTVRSLSARRAWIEINPYRQRGSANPVALRKESVDRNCGTAIKTICAAVALRKESVDRNFHAVQIVIVVMESLSARRAWIEIPCAAILSALAYVALRKESVDRNNRRFATIHNTEMSLSARRAWIEIVLNA